MVVQHPAGSLELSIAYLGHLATMVESFGAPRATVLRAAPDPAAIAGETPPTISGNELEQTLAQALAATQEPSLGFLFGLAMQPSWHGLAGFAVMSASTVQEALDFVLRAYPLVLPGLGLHATRDHEQLRLVVALDDAFPISRSFVLGTALVGCAAMASALTGCEFPGELAFDFPRPSTLAGYAEAFPFTMTFDADECALAVPLDFLATPMRSADPYSLAQARAHCERQLLAIEQRRPLTRRVRALIPHDGTLRAQAEVAQLLGQSPRTLSRGLAAEGTSFSEVADGLRHALATELLARPELTLDDIAERVGYSDAANFGRAFRRWRGVSPGAFRKAVLGDA